MVLKVYEWKNCIYCGSKKVQKYGLVKGVQRYKCSSCGKQFIGGIRIKDSQLWGEYTLQKQTYKQLSKRYHCSIRTIQRRLDRNHPVENSCHPKSKEVIVLMDTTYWGVILE